jgi:hypothetical protein
MMTAKAASATMVLVGGKRGRRLASLHEQPRIAAQHMANMTY